MRKFMEKLFGAGRLLLLFCAAAFLFLLYHAPVFEAGEGYTFHFGANSSAQFSTASSPFEKILLGEVKGESVQYEGNQLLSLQKRFRAKLLFTEEICGVKNYYFYSPCLKDAVLLEGHAVNLQIALSEEKTVAGTPIIFGGY